MNELRVFKKEMDVCYARQRSPTFQGKPKTPTASLNDQSEQIANTQFVKSAIADFWNKMPECYYEVRKL